MSKKFDKYTELKVLRAYLIEGLSHRQIQREILNLPAPARGGGFVAMEILHKYGITGKYKGIYSNIVEKEFYPKLKSLVTDQEILKNIAIEIEAEKQINDKQFSLDNKETEKVINTKTRIYQDVLRKRVLKNYNNECACCKINQQDLLICSHIKPWSEDIKNRLNPQNTICFCPLHDKLFDKGYFSLSNNYEIIFSEKADFIIKETFGNLVFKKPYRESPDTEFLTYHRKEICGIEI